MRGIIVGQESLDTALVRLASVAEAARLLATPGDVHIGIARDLSSPPALGGRVYIESEAGQIVELGIANRVDFRRDFVDVTGLGDAFARYAPGRGMTITLEVVR